MARYADISAFRRACANMDFRNRESFLAGVKLAKIEKYEPFVDEPSARAIVFAQEADWVAKSYACTSCNYQFYMRSEVRSSGDGGLWIKYQWRGSREDRDDGCEQCCGKYVSMTSGTPLGITGHANWLHLLDAMVMWLQDYPRLTIQREIDGYHQKLDHWLEIFQKAVARDINGKVIWEELASDMDNDSGGTGIKQKRGRSQTRKKPSGRRAMQKRPAAKAVGAPRKKPAAPQGKFKRRPKKIIVQMDESYLNKKKAGKLTKRGRPQHDQVWIWGAIVQGYSTKYFVYRILEHPMDSWEGKPRGKEEILQNLYLLGLPHRNVVLVSDKWLGTLSAVRQYRAENGLTERTLPHKIVNHSEGEIVNSDGYTTNGIEAKWSTIKRWVRKKVGGRMPTHADRDKWRLLIAEFQYRAYYGTPCESDCGNTNVVRWDVFRRTLGAYFNP